MKQPIYHLFLFIAALVVAACSTERPDSSSEVDRAIYLIDNGQSSEAIYTMRYYVQQNPLDERGKLVLASAYAARLGLNIAQFAQFAANIIQWHKDSAAAAVSQPGADPDLAALNSAFQKLYGVTRLLKSIPVVRSSDQRADLEAAIAVLGGDSDIYGGPSLYRGSLKVVLFKDNLLRRNKLIYEAGGGGAKCQAQIDSATAWLKAIEADLVQALFDIGFGLSDKQAQSQIVAFATALRDAIAAVTNVRSRSRSRDNSVLTFQGVLRDIYPQCF